jgi:hypothetical protein
MKKLKSKLKGSAVMLSLFILVGVMIVVLGGASVIISGLKMGTLQSHSTKAYFAAEAGTERLLYEFRKTSLWSGLGGDNAPKEDLFGTVTLSIGSEYIVNYTSYNPLTFTGIGSFGKTRRSVEVSFYD